MHRCGSPLDWASISVNRPARPGGKPAVSIYEEYFGREASELRAEPLARMAITYPLGMRIAGSDEYLIRDAISVGELGELVCAAEVPVGSQVRLMIGGKQQAI